MPGSGKRGYMNVWLSESVAQEHRDDIQREMEQMSYATQLHDCDSRPPWPQRLWLWCLSMLAPAVSEGPECELPPARRYGRP